ncbi:APC family permease [Sulfuracidifex metallicus]|uniref:Amino acid permease n=1 Tax=Sulfuracidifex metallicus DSM 6482 = JCM 9184 TaxID=523847 RepID=A0A6A9QR67_SULME|nr:APC family permease [Sulfuracidifex metallicus]MUN29681.1 amino acid permease [Sulfuracidifex metallicus DSM 6482 = JCM 9184]WOE49812.1 APC family permease [Sulfuracidifex metallicus DSM 6482 = JCM 9184]
MASETEVKNSDKLLRKQLNLLDLTFLSMGGIIGSGWLFASLDAASTAGPSAILSWLIAGFLIIFVGLAYSEIASAIPKTGGIVRYPHYTHGSYTGYILGFLYLLSAITLPAIEAEGAIEYISSVNPNFILSYTTTINGSTVTVLNYEGLGLAFLLMLFFFFLNYGGIKVLGKSNTGITAWKVVIPTITFILLFAVYHSANFSSYGGLFPSNVTDASSGIIGPAAMLYAIPSSGIIFSYLGFRQAVEYSGEARNPQKDVGRAVILSLILGITIYTMLQVSFIGALDWGKAGITPGDWGALLSSNFASSPFYSEFTSTGIALFGAWGTILLIDAIISPTGTGLVYTGTSTRTIYGLAMDSYFPNIFAKVGRTGIPFFALLASLIVGSIFLAPFPSWYLLVGFISSATVFTYIMGGIGLESLRRNASDLKRPYRVPAARIIAPIATIAAILIVYWSGFTTLFYILSGLTIGVPLFWLYYAVNHIKMNRTLAYLLGIGQLLASLGLISFGYYNVILNSSPSLESSFILYYLGFIGMLVVPTIIGYSFSNEEGRREIKSGFWLIGLILVLYATSFFGGFGPLSSPLIPFPEDTIVAAIVGLIFHFAAVRSAFRTEEIERIIEEQEG